MEAGCYANKPDISYFTRKCTTHEKTYDHNVIAIFSYCPQVNAQQLDTAKENSAIRQLVKNYELAWNRHDPKGLAANYRSEATWVNWFCAYYKGRQDIEDQYCTINTYFKPSHYYTRAIWSL